MSRLRWPDSTNSVSEKPGTIQRARFHQVRPSRDIKGVFEVAVANERGQILDRKRYGRASFQRFLETRAPLA